MINKRQAMLHTYLGITLHHQKKFNEALKTFQCATEIDPQNPLNEYQKSQVLLSLQRDQEALDLLLQLNRSVPKEAPIHINIGQIYKKLGKLDEAMKYFQRALDLDPKDINQVKSMIERIHQSQNEMNDEGEDAEFA